MGCTWHIGFMPCVLSRCGSASIALLFALLKPSRAVDQLPPAQLCHGWLPLLPHTREGSGASHQADCSMWSLHHRRMLESLERVLMNSLEEECSCSVSDQPAGLVPTSSCPVQVPSSVVIGHPQLPYQDSPCSSQPCRLALDFLPGLGNFHLFWDLSCSCYCFFGLAFYFIKRHPQNYTNIQMNDRRQMAAADF
ncbi:unnamed protein product [Coccothraustes coccothraustes]